jgi:hypothetical protein
MSPPAFFSVTDDHMNALRGFLFSGYIPGMAERYTTPEQMAELFQLYQHHAATELHAGQILKEKGFCPEFEEADADASAIYARLTALKKSLGL